MEADRGRAWRALWETKGALGLRGEGDILSRLLATDGFEAGLGRLTGVGWQSWVDRIAELLELRGHHRLLDVGCGAGPLLYCLRDRVARLAGVDYSEAMLRVARAHNSARELAVAEAGALPFRAGSFDRVAVSGVFLYFPSYEYARRAIQELLRVCARPGGRAVLMDVPDLARREEAEALRAVPSDRVRLSSDPALTHLYYPREFFEQQAASLGAAVEISNQAIPGYANGAFRFNVLFKTG